MNETPMPQGEDRARRQVELRDKLTAASNLLSGTIARYAPKMVVALMSGGDDSLPATMIASFDPHFSGVLHINTGIGIEETRELRANCSQIRISGQGLRFPWLCIPIS